MGNGVSHKSNDLLCSQASIPLRRSSKKLRKEPRIRQSFRAGVVADRHWQERIMESIG